MSRLSRSLRAEPPARSDGQPSVKPFKPRYVGIPPLHPKVLIGREPDIEKAVQTVLAESPGCRLLIHGPHGVGKTSLAIHLVHRLIQRGQWTHVVWLDCQTKSFDLTRSVSTPNPIKTYTDLLRELAIALEDGRALRAEIDERASFVQESLSVERVLLIADNLDDLGGSEVVSFLTRTPMSVDVVGTSREDLHWRLGQLLQPIGEGSAKQFYSTLLPTTELYRVSQLYELSGGVPQTIKAVAKLADLGYSTEEIGNRLARSPESLGEFYYKKQWEMIRSRKNLLRAIILLAATRPTMTVREAKEILQASQSPSQTHDAIVDLTKWQLVDRVGDSLEVIPLVSRFFREQFVTMQGTVRRVHLMYMRWLNEELQDVSFAHTWAERFRRGDELRDHILEVATSLVEGDDLETKELGSRIVLSASYYLFCRGYWQELLAADRLTSPVLAELGMFEDVAWQSLTWAIKAIRMQQGVAVATERFSTVEAVLRQLTGALTEEQDAIIATARATLRQRDLPAVEVAQMLEQRSELLHISGKHLWACTARLRAGNVWRESGRLDEAVQAYDWVNNVAEMNGHDAWSIEMKAWSRGSLGEISNCRGQWQEAISHLEAALPDIVQIPDIATVLIEIGYANAGLGKLDEANRAVTKGKRIAATAGIAGSLCESAPGWDERFESESGPVLRE